MRVKIPRFGEHEEENRKVIAEMMEVYLEEVGKREKEIEKTDREIDRGFMGYMGLYLKRSQLWKAVAWRK